MFLSTALSFVSVQVLAQDITRLGGEMTSDLPGRAAIQVNAPNVTDEDRRIKQIQGFSIFHGIFTQRVGLGNLFNNTACSGCHINNGRGQVKFSQASDQSRAIVKVSLNKMAADGGLRPIPGYGTQLHDHSVKANDPKVVAIKIAWLTRPGVYPDGTKYTLRRPSLSFKIPGYTTKDFRYSLRATPPVIGPGLLESIPEETILALADPSDKNKDGISGKPQYVPDPEKGGALSLGRFGFKATAASVAHQTAAAFFNDMGLGTKLLPMPVEGQEVSDNDFDINVFYQKLAGVPPARNQSDSNVIRGKYIFSKIGCDGCHTMTFVTHSDTDPELNNQTIHPFTDLLLHDMGLGLADTLPMYKARANEWKTAPLWGLGFSLDIAEGGRVGFLHDGRARNIEEAILWHGGEAATSQKEFTLLKKNDRSALLLFLRSL